MRYMGAVGALTMQDRAAVSAFAQTYAQLSPEAQAAIYDDARASGGGADAHMRERAIFAGIGAAIGLVVGVALARRRR